MDWETKLAIICVVWLIPLGLYIFEQGTLKHNSHADNEYCPRCRPMSYF